MYHQRSVTGDTQHQRAKFVIIIGEVVDFRFGEGLLAVCWHVWFGRRIGLNLVLVLALNVDFGRLESLVNINLASCSSSRFPSST
jgi:hypothetical protein